MKKFFLSILVLIYFGVSSGIAMEIHYCMGERTGFDLFKAGDSKCGKCGMQEKKGGCCEDDHQFYKLSDAHKHITNDLDFGFGFADYDLPPAPSSFHVTPDPDYISLSSSSSPPGSSIPIYLFKNVFRL